MAIGAVGALAVFGSDSFPPDSPLSPRTRFGPVARLDGRQLVVFHISVVFHMYQSGASKFIIFYFQPMKKLQNKYPSSSNGQAILR